MLTRRSVLASLCVAAPAADDPIMIPARLNAEYKILVPVRINNLGPLWCILDSGGASQVYIDRQTAVEFGVKPASEGRSAGPQADAMIPDGRARALVAVAGVNLGAPVVVIKPFRMRESVIGMTLLSRYVVELDYRNASVRLHHPGSFRHSGDAVPFWLEPAFAYNPFTNAHLTTGRQEVAARLGIDTGCGGCSVWLSKSFVDRHEDLGTITRLSVGGVSVSNPVVRVAARRGFGGGREPDGLLGVEFLRPFKVYFDYTRSRLILGPRGVPV